MAVQLVYEIVERIYNSNQTKPFYGAIPVARERDIMTGVEEVTKKVSGVSECNIDNGQQYFTINYKYTIEAHCLS